jgi:hypothetical protein
MPIKTYFTRDEMLGICERLARIIRKPKIQVVTMEALRLDGSVFCSYRFPLPGEAPEAPEDWQGHMREAAKALGEAAREAGVTLAHPPLRVTHHSIPRSEHYDTIRLPSAHPAIDRLIMGTDGGDS